MSVALPVVKPGAAGGVAVARRADPTRSAEPTSVFRRREAKPRRALTGPTSGSSRRVPRTVFSAIAGAVVVTGLAVAAPSPASAASVSQRLPHLHPGAHNSLVVRLQRELSAHGRNVRATGYYGNQTTRRVKSLQRHHGWRATGNTGSRVWHVLLSDRHPVKGPSITPYLAGHKKSAASHHKAAKSHRSAASNTVWDKIAQCESSGNWHINTGNGFYGGLQFSLSTWHGYGGSGLPNRHSRTEQITVAKRVQSSQGWGAWPACSARVGLR
jgi:hypothetical protein